jgi:hypothetical protein
VHSVVKKQQAGETQNGEMLGKYEGFRGGLDSILAFSSEERNLKKCAGLPRCYSIASAMNARNRRAYCSGSTVDIPAHHSGRLNLSFLKKRDTNTTCTISMFLYYCIELSISNLAAMFRICDN